MVNEASMKRIHCFFTLFFLIVFPVSGISAAEPLGKRILLENGMVVLLSEKHTLPMVTVDVAIRAGSTMAPADKPGLASVTASLLMEGTRRRSAEQISREIDFIGGSLSTAGGSDYASADLRVLTKDLRTGLDLLADVLMNPVFPQKEIDRFIKETLAEIQRQKEEPDTIASEAFGREVFGSHPYGRTSEEIAAYLKKMKRREIREFYRSQYGPDNTIIAVVGDTTEQEIVALLTTAFKGWKRTPRPLPAPVPIPEITKTVVRKIDKNITQANIIMGHRGISREHPDYYAIVVMNYILGGGGFSSRLMDNIRDNRGLAYSVYSYFAARKETGSFAVEIQTKNDSANEALSEILKEIRTIQTKLVSQEELADAKAYLTGSFPLRMDTYGKIAGTLVFAEIYGLGLDYPRKYLSSIRAVTRKDVLNTARKYLHPDEMVIVVVADQKKAKLNY